MFSNYKKLKAEGKITLTKLPGNAVAVTYPVAPDRYDHRVLQVEHIHQHEQMLLTQVEETEALAVDVQELLAQGGVV